MVYLGAVKAARVSRPFHLLSILLLLCLLLTSPEIALSDQAEPRTVDASGIAVITNGNTAVARDAAISDALRKAVEQAVGTIVSSDTMVENYQVLRDSVYTKTQGYIKSYTVTNESGAQGVYQVSVKAVVSVGPLMDDLAAMGILQKKAGRPRVLFLMAEKNVGRKYFTFWWWGKSEYKGEAVEMSAAESSLKSIFINKGFEVVDESGGMDSIRVTEPLRIADLTGDGAREIAKSVNAEVVVFGKALAEQGPGIEGSAMGLYMADVSAQAVRVDDGVVLGSARGHATARNISRVTGSVEALEKASADMASKLIEQITFKWTGPGSVIVRVTGIKDYKSLADLKSALKSRVRGVQAVYQRKFEGTGAVLELESGMSAQAIADDIAAMGMALRVVNTTPNTIEVSMDGASAQ